MSSSELPKIVSKSPVEIEAAIPAIESSNLPPDIKDFVISCIRLSIWPPSELLNHQITVANLRKLVFGRDDKNKRNKQSNSNANKCSKEKSAKMIIKISYIEGQVSSYRIKISHSVSIKFFFLQ